MQNEVKKKGRLNHQRILSTYYICSITLRKCTHCVILKYLNIEIILRAFHLAGTQIVNTFYITGPQHSFNHRPSIEVYQRLILVMIHILSHRNSLWDVCLLLCVLL